ncbi:hypothetical protein [Sphingomonas sp. BAUL-RG-20F-R05-02]|uniref:hypothetical protein n=1 Tax=Sphingomonas sp. BAUL-RG-20F-R05-02 TaxID=2914830 RepID=UPI001F56F0D6|nr:hypothetical protein [Sphingomonas sp. BAUL-RG-20F-R05-02]
MFRYGLFALAMTGCAVPVAAQQRTDADEAFRAGEAQRVEAATFPALSSSMNTRSSRGIAIAVGGTGDGDCWAARKGKRVSADQAGALGPIGRSQSFLVVAERGAPAACLGQAVAALHGKGYAKFLPLIARD